MTKSMVSLCGGCLLAVSVLAGCGNSEQPNASVPATSPSAEGSTTDSEYVLAEEPADAKGVGTVRESSEDGEEVTIVGRIGGAPDPFVKGLAAFTIVDPSLDPCPPDEGCPTPWDYCCDFNLLAKNKATVKLVDAAGKPVTTDSRELLPVKELSTVVVQGKAQRDEAGNLTVLADRVFVKGE